MSLHIDGTFTRGDLTLELRLDLPAGVTAIVGPNGSGKSSILRTSNSARRTGRRSRTVEVCSKLEPEPERDS